MLLEFPWSFQGNIPCLQTMEVYNLIAVIRKPIPNIDFPFPSDSLPKVRSVTATQNAFSNLMIYRCEIYGSIWGLLLHFLLPVKYT